MLFRFWVFPNCTFLDISTAPFGFIDKLLITDFSVPSVLWGIDGDWMTSYLPSDMPFYPTDHCGVLRCKNSEVNPRYLAHILEVEGRKMGFSRSYRASIDRVHGIAFTVPDISSKAGLFPRKRRTDPALLPTFGGSAPGASDPRSLPCASLTASHYLRPFSLFYHTFDRYCDTLSTYPKWVWRKKEGLDRCCKYTCLVTVKAGSGWTDMGQ